MRFLLFIVPIFLGVGYSTYLFAEAVNFNTIILGEPTLGLFYWPWKIFPWMKDYYGYAPELFHFYPIIFGFIVGLLLLWITKPEKQLDSHGSARWANYEDLLKMDLISGSGVCIGLYDSNFKKSLTKMLRYLEYKKNEAMGYAEKAYDESEDTRVAKQRQQLLRLKQKYKLASTQEERQAIKKAISALEAEIANPKGFTPTLLGSPKAYFYKNLHKKASKLYTSLNHFYLRDNSNKHMAVIAPTRSGKGVGLIIPTLLGSWKSSTIVNDIKSENWGITAGYRQKMGQLVIKFEPTAADGSSARWNPLEEIPLGNPMEVSMAQNLAAIIADYEGKGKPDHWTANASNVIMCTLLHLKYAHVSDPKNYPNPPSLYTVAAFLKATVTEKEDGSLDIKGFTTMLETLMGFEHVPDEGIDIKEWSNDKSDYVTRHFTPADLADMYPGSQSLGMLPNTHPIIFQAFAEIKSKPDNELGSIISTANTALKEYLDPVLAMNTSISDFCVDDIMNYKKPISLYLVTPPSDLLRLSPIFRLFFEMMVRHHARDIGTYVNGQAKTKYKHKCLFLMDEFSALGNLQSFASTLSYIAGYGMKVFLICQGLPQIASIYGKDNQILMNCHLQIIYSPNENDTAKYAESLLGNKTILVKSKSSGGGGLFNLGGNTSTNATGRALMTADELTRLGDREIILASGNPPILTDKIKYYENKYFLDRLVQAPIVSDVVRNNPNPKREALLASQQKPNKDKKAQLETFVYDDNITKTTKQSEK